MRSALGSVMEVDKGKRYRVFVTTGFDPITGKRIRKSKMVRGTRADAERFKAAWLAKLGDEPSTDMPLDDFWEYVYLPSCKARLRPTTIQGYEGHYSVHIREKLGFVNLSKITPAMIADWLSSIEGTSRKFEAYKMLRQILNKAVTLNFIKTNPCKNVERPQRNTSYEPELIGAKDARTYIRVSHGKPWEKIVLMAIGAGLRRSEIVGLDWSDISSDGAVMIDNGITSVKGKAHDDDPKSKFGRRKVYLPQSIHDRLEELREEGPFIQDSNGNRMNPDNVSKLYSKLFDELPAGVPHVSLKNLRHSSLTLALEGGSELLAVSRRAGHSSVNITAKYYLRPSDEVDKKAARGLDSLL